MLSSRNRKTHIEQLEEDTNTSSAWYLSVLSFCLMLSQTVKEALGLVPEEYCSDNSANKPVLYGASGWTSVLQWMSPVLIGLMWFNTFRACRNLYRAENRNFERYADVAISVVTSVGWTSLYVIGMTSVAPLIPYIAAAVLGVNALYGLFNCCKNLYYAWHAQGEERKKFLWNAAKQIVGIVVNTLGFVVGLFLGIKTSEAVDVMSQHFEIARKALFGLAAAVIVGITMETKKLNRETLEIIRHPIEACKQAVQAIGKNPLMLIKMLVMIPLRVAALVVAPLQLIAYGIKKLMSNNTPQSKIAPVRSAAAVVDSQLEFECLVSKVQNKIRQLKGQSHTAEREAKITLLREILRKKLGVTKDKEAEIPDIVTFKKDISLDRLEQRAKKLNRNVYCSFFRRESEVKQIVNDVRKFQSSFCSPAA